MTKASVLFILISVFTIAACSPTGSEVEVPVQVAVEAEQAVRNFFAIASETVGFDYELAEFLTTRIESVAIPEAYKEANIDSMWCASVDFKLRHGQFGVLDQWVDRVLVARVFKSAENEWVSELAGSELSEESLPADMPIDEMGQLLWDTCIVP